MYLYGATLKDRGHIILLLLVCPSVFLSVRPSVRLSLIIHAKLTFHYYFKNILSYNPYIWYEVNFCGVTAEEFTLVVPLYLSQKGLNASAKSFGHCQPAQSAQADIGQNFSLSRKFL